jgi:hypothetical protein
MPFGYNTFIAWVAETVWGTAVTPPTRFAEIVTESLRIIRRREMRQPIRGLDPVEGGLYDALNGGVGGVVMELNYGGFLRAMEHLLGDSSISTTVLEAVISWTHSGTLKDTVMAGEGLTLYKNVDLDGGTPTMQFAGYKINQMRFAMQPDRNTQVEMIGVAKDEVDVATPAATYPVLANYVAGHQTILKLDDTEREFDTAELLVDNGLVLEKRVMGSKTIAEPKRGASRRAITGRITMDAVAADLAKFKAGTLLKLELLSTGPVLGANNFRNDFTMPKCLIEEDPIVIPGIGVLQSSFPFRAIKPTSGELFTWDVVNDEETIT